MAARDNRQTEALAVDVVVLVPVLVHVHRTVEFGQLVGQQPDVGLEETQFQRDRLPDELSVFALVSQAHAVASAVFGRGPIRVHT